MTEEIEQKIKVTTVKDVALQSLKTQLDQKRNELKQLLPDYREQQLENKNLEDDAKIIQVECNQLEDKILKA